MRTLNLLAWWVVTGLLAPDVAAAQPANPFADRIVSASVANGSMIGLVRQLAGQAGVTLTITTDAEQAISGHHVSVHIPPSRLDDALQAVLACADGGGCTLDAKATGYKVGWVTDWRERPAYRPDAIKAPAIARRKVTITLSRALPFEAVNRLFRSNGAGYAINDTADGSIALNVSDVTLDDAAAAVANGWHGAHRLAFGCTRFGTIYSVRRVPDLGRRSTNVTVRLDRVPLPAALMRILDAAGADYVICDDLGSDLLATCDLRNRPLHEALQAAWRSAGITEAADLASVGGVYTMHPPMNVEWKIRRSMPEVHLSTRLRQANVRSALKSMFNYANASFTIDQAVGGPVTLAVRSVSGSALLKQLLARCRYPSEWMLSEEGVYRVRIMQADSAR